MDPVSSSPATWVNPKDGYEMVYIPGGEFSMGTAEKEKDGRADERPRHRHRLAPYYIGIFPVTVDQFARFVAATGYHVAGPWRSDPYSHPVRFLQLADAKAYAGWSGLRLPREAEWELAARGYEASRYPWGDDWQGGRRLHWSGAAHGAKGTVPVDRHPEGVSPFGVFQMSGNLWEWCDDWYEEKAYQRYAKGDFSPPPSGGRGRVLRGGSWFGLDGGPGAFRCARRFCPEGSAYLDKICGLRLSRSA